MAKNRWKRQLSLTVLLLAVCGAAACGRKGDGSDGAAKAETLKSMAQIKKLSFRETFGQYFEVEVIATEDKILYRCSKQDVLGKTEPEVISKSFGCGHDTWWDLMSVYNYNYVYDWQEQEYYVNKCYGQEPGLFEEYPEVEFLEAGDFFNIAGASPDLIQAGALAELIQRYEVGSWEDGAGGTGYVRQGGFYNAENAGLVEDANERAFRSRYDALIHVVYTDGEHTEIQLENGGLPGAYNDFRDELWDAMIPYINEGQEAEAPDWRDSIDQWGKEYMCIKYPYMK